MKFEMTNYLLLVEYVFLGSMMLGVSVLWQQFHGRPWFWFYLALGRVRFWKTVFSLFLLTSSVSFFTSLAVFETATGLPPWAPPEAPNSFQAIVIGFVASAAAAGAAGACLMKALYASVIARDMAAFHRMYSTVGFVVVCIGGAGVAFGQSVPQINQYLRYADVEVMTSGAQTIDASVVIAGTRNKPKDAEKLQVNNTFSAEDPTGQVSVEIQLRGVPKTEVDIAVEYSDLESVADLAVDIGGFTDVTIFPSRLDINESWDANLDTSSGTGKCLMSSTKSDFAYPSPIVVRGRALLDVAGQATVWIVWDVKHGWTETTGGGRNTVTLPGISIPVALPGGCTILRGAKTGKWDFPESATGSIGVAALLPVDAQISANPPLTAPDGLVRSPSLSWTRAFRSAGDSLLAPQYAIQTNDTTRLANVNLFVAGLLGGAALGGIFEISREWPTNFSLRSPHMEPSAVRAPGAAPKPPFSRISRHPEWRSTIHPVRRRSRQSRGTR